MHIDIYPSVLTTGTSNSGSGYAIQATVNFIGQFSILVTHNKGIRPIVSISNNNGEKIEGQVFYNDLNNFTVSFNSPQSGSITYI